MGIGPGHRTSVTFWAVVVIGVFALPIVLGLVDVLHTSTFRPPDLTDHLPDGTEQIGLPIDPCPVLGAEELERELGATNPGVPGGQPELGIRSCTWTTWSDSPVTLTLTVRSDGPQFVPPGAALPESFEDGRARAHVDEDLDLGESAYRAGTTISVLDDSLTWTVTTTDDSPAGIRALKALTTSAVRSGRLFVLDGAVLRPGGEVDDGAG